ncbi:MAG: hypothetical protein REI94_02260, partial [Moraxellaceae bacterium]|nr:hypothetical protein [Moraxellaceae bacterium]
MSKKAKMRGAALAAPMPRALSAGQRLDRLLGNYLSTMAFLIGAYFICFELSPFHQRELTRDFNFAYIGLPLEPLGFSTSFVPVQWIFRALIVIYGVVLLRFYLKYPYIRSKAFIFLRGLWPSIRREKGFSRDTKQAGLALLLKFFFAPLMINWCWGHIA